MGEMKPSLALTASKKGKKENTTNVLSCSVFVQILSVRSSRHFPFETHRHTLICALTHAYTRRQLLVEGNGGVHGHMFTVRWTRELQVAAP